MDFPECIDHDLYVFGQKKSVIIKKQNTQNGMLGALQKADIYEYFILICFVISFYMDFFETIEHDIYVTSFLAKKKTVIMKKQNT